MEALNREIRFNRIPIRAIHRHSSNIGLFFLPFCKDFFTPYENVEEQIYVLPKLYAASGNVDVEVYQHGYQPECAFLVEPMDEEEFKELLVAEDLTTKQFAAICYAVLCSNNLINLYSYIVNNPYKFVFPELSQDAYFGYMTHITRMLYHGSGDRYYHQGDFDSIIDNVVNKFCMSQCGYSIEEKDAKEEYISMLNELEFCDRSNLNNYGMRYMMAYKDVYDSNHNEMSSVGEMLREEVKNFKTIIQLFR